MNLQESINALQVALEKVVEATLSDDKTVLGNSLALEKVASLVGSGGDSPDVVVFGDINDFHNFNNLWGHEAGDAAITRVGQGIKASFVDECEARAFRKSGDEFVILLSSSHLDKFKAKVPAFVDCSFKIEGETRHVSISFGYAISTGEIAFSDLIARAEVACQVAKAKGGGVCVEWSDEIEKQAMQSIRGRCPTCEASITCYVRTEMKPKDSKFLCCPCCGNSLAEEASAI
jgi:diguanylate cyclase (GGDEF)-like protein